MGRLDLTNVQNLPPRVTTNPIPIMEEQMLSWMWNSQHISWWTVVRRRQWHLWGLCSTKVTRRWQVIVSHSDLKMNGFGQTAQARVYYFWSANPKVDEVHSKSYKNMQWDRGCRRSVGICELLKNCIISARFSIVLKNLKYEVGMIGNDSNEPTFCLVWANFSNAHLQLSVTIWSEFYPNSTQVQ